MVLKLSCLFSHFYNQLTPQNEKCKKKISFLILTFAVAGMLADINSGLAFICHIWGFYLNYIKLTLHPCYSPIPYKKWTKKTKQPQHLFSLFSFLINWNTSFLGSVFDLFYVDPNCWESGSRMETLMKAVFLWLSPTY